MCVCVCIHTYIYIYITYNDDMKCRYALHTRCVQYIHTYVDGQSGIRCQYADEDIDVCIDICIYKDMSNCGHYISY